MSLTPRHVLVTGATGFVGAHVVDLLLERGIRVTATVRSQARADEIKTRWEKYGDLFSVAVTGDLATSNVFDGVVKDVDVVIHLAAPVPDGRGTPDIERDILLPSIQGTQSILKSVQKSPSVKRVVLSSSFAAVFDHTRPLSEPYTYTSEDWCPVTYEEALSTTDLFTVYRASKKFAELEAWNWVRSSSSVNAKGEKIDLSVLVPPMAIGPWVHPLESLSALNTSMQPQRDMVLGIQSRLTAAPRPPVWVDVRDLALAHVEAAYIRPETSNKRFVVCSPEKTDLRREAEIIREAFPEWAGRVVVPTASDSMARVGLDGSSLTSEFGIKYTSLRDCVLTMAKQLHDQAVKEGLVS